MRFEDQRPLSPTVTAALSLRFDVDRDSLILAADLENTGEAPVNRVGVAFVAPSFVKREHELSVSGAGDAFSSLLLAEGLPAHSSVRVERFVELECYVDGVVLLQHVGLVVDGKSRALADLATEIPRDLKLEVMVEPSHLVVGSIGVANVSVANMGRSRVTSIAVNVSAEDGLSILRVDPKAKGSSLNVGRLEIGERRVFVVSMAAPTITERTKRTMQAVATADGVSARGHAIVEILAPRLLRVDVKPVSSAAWEAGTSRPVEVRISNDGVGTARHVEVVAWVEGLLRVGLGEVGATRTVRNGRRVSRWLIDELAPNQSRTYNASLTPMVGDESHRAFCVEATVAEPDDIPAHGDLAIELCEGTAFGNGTTLIAPEESASAGDLIVVGVEVENAGTVPMRGLVLSFSSSPALVLENVDYPGASIEGSALLLGTLGAGTVLQTGVWFRVGVLERGIHELYVSAEASAFNAYGVDLPAAKVTVSAVSAVDVALRASAGGVISGSVANVGDAVEPEVVVRAEVVNGMLLPGSTMVSDRVLADTNGMSPLVGGIRIRDLEPGARVTFQGRVVGDGTSEATVTVSATTETETRTSPAVKTMGVLSVETLDLGDSGFKLDAAILALPVPETDAVAVPDAMTLLAPHEADIADDEPLHDGADLSAETHVVESVVTAADVVPAARDLERPREVVVAEEEIAPDASSSDEVLVAAESAPEPSTERETAVREGEVELHPDAAASIAVKPRERVEAHQVLRQVPLVFEATASWLRAIVVALDPLVKAPVRDLAVHALALRFFLPEMIVAETDETAHEEVTAVLAQLARIGKTEALRAATMVGSPTFRVTDAWLRSVESDALRSEAERFAQTLATTQYLAVERDLPAEALRVKVDLVNLRSNVMRRFADGDATATSWLFLTLFPTEADLAAGGLAAALAAYRKAFEAALYEVGVADNVLRTPATQELDDALTALHDELRAVAPPARAA